MMLVENHELDSFLNSNLCARFIASLDSIGSWLYYVLYNKFLTENFDKVDKLLIHQNFVFVFVEVAIGPSLKLKGIQKTP